MQELHSLAGLVGAFRRPRGYPIALAPQTPVRCPRCDSANTKFCYYNNYNLSQPRHFCKSCRRYWTRGGLLRNVPVGGGTRKSKSKSSKSSSSSSSSKSSRNKPPAAKSASPSHASSASSSVELEQNINSSSLNTMINPVPIPLTDAGEAALQDPTVGFGFLDAGDPQMGPITDVNLPSMNGNLCTGDGMNGSGLLFDVTGPVDSTVQQYWNNCSWGDTDPSSTLYLP